VIRDGDAFIIRKNRKLAIGSLIIVAFMVPVSIWLLVAGLRLGRPEVAWAVVIFGIFGTFAFLASAVAIVRTLISPWRLVLERTGLTFYAPAFDLDVPWEQIVGIAVDEVYSRPGCVLVFDDVEAVIQRATFHPGRANRDAVGNATEMRQRMVHNYETMGYHLGIPRRLLELGPEALASTLAQARTGELWREGGKQS
jgi:hypothetical protein